MRTEAEGRAELVELVVAIIENRPTAAWALLETQGLPLWPYYEFYPPGVAKLSGYLLAYAPNAPDVARLNGGVLAEYLAQSARLMEGA